MCITTPTNSSHWSTGTTLHYRTCAWATIERLLSYQLLDKWDPLSKNRPHCILAKNKIITPAESASITDDYDTFIFWIGLTVPRLNASKCDQYFTCLWRFYIPNAHNFRPAVWKWYIVKGVTTFSSYKAEVLHVHLPWALKHIRCMHSTLNFKPT